MAYDNTALGSLNTVKVLQIITLVYQVGTQVIVALHALSYQNVLAKPRQAPRQQPHPADKQENHMAQPRFIICLPT
jgi:hypothetical protein